MTTKHPISTVVDTLDEATNRPHSSLGDLLEEFGQASFSSMLLAITLMLVSPLSAVPLFSSTCGILIFVISAQAAVGREHLWLPNRLLSVEIRSNRADGFIQYLRRAALWLEGRTRFRFRPLVSPPARRALYGLCSLAGACLPFLELIPLSSSIVGLSIALIAISLLTRDGLITVLGLLVLVAASAIPYAAVTAFII